VRSAYLRRGFGGGGRGAARRGWAQANAPLDDTKNPAERDAEPDEHQYEEQQLAHGVIVGGCSSATANATHDDVGEEPRHSPAERADHEAEQRAEAGEDGAGEQVAQIEAVKHVPPARVRAASSGPGGRAASRPSRAPGELGTEHLAQKPAAKDEKKQNHQ